MDFCEMMGNSVITNPIFNFYFGFIKKYTPNIHKCPFKKHEEIMLKDFRVDYNLIPPALLILEGRFRIDIDYYNTKLGESVYYIKSSTFITIQKRFPYKKRARTSKQLMDDPSKRLI
jgi:hypothetical protein